jgi:hypothetical protein
MVKSLELLFVYFLLCKRKSARDCQACQQQQDENKKREEKEGNGDFNKCFLFLCQQEECEEKCFGNEERKKGFGLKLKLSPASFLFVSSLQSVSANKEKRMDF